MVEWSVDLATWLCILTAVIATHSLILTIQFFAIAEGYMWRAARKIWGFLTLFLLVEWLIGISIFTLFKAIFVYVSYPLWLLGITIGIIVAWAPTALEVVLLPKKRTTLQKLQRPVTRLLRKLNLALRHNFAWAIESRRQQDLYDCQHPGGWGLGLTPTDIGRRLRILYEVAKCDIAKGRKDSSLVVFDVGRNPWEKFYLLVKHVGRKRLRQYLVSPLSPCDNWDGRERRRKVGNKADRDPNLDNAPHRSRVYDDHDYMKQIDEGTCDRRSSQRKSENT